MSFSFFYFYSAWLSLQIDLSFPVLVLTLKPLIWLPFGCLGGQLLRHSGLVDNVLCNKKNTNSFLTFDPKGG